jgi:hypothetical protein
VAFFFAPIHEGIDRAQDWASLAQELRALDPQGELGRRSVDTLLRVIKRGSGGTRYLHAEVQCQVDADFPGFRSWAWVSTELARRERRPWRPLLTWAASPDLPFPATPAGSQGGIGCVSDSP